MPDNTVTIGIVTQPTSPIDKWVPFGTDYVPSPYVDWVCARRWKCWKPTACR